MTLAAILASLFPKRPPEPEWIYSADGWTRAADGVVEQFVSTGWSEYWDRI